MSIDNENEHNEHSKFKDSHNEKEDSRSRSSKSNNDEDNNNDNNNNSTSHDEDEISDQIIPDAIIGSDLPQESPRYVAALQSSRKVNPSDPSASKGAGGGGGGGGGGRGGDVEKDDTLSYQQCTQDIKKYEEVKTENVIEINDKDGGWQPTEWEKQQKKAHQYQVVWNENDPENPKNWKRSRKWLITLAVSVVVFCVSYASSAYAGAFRDIMRVFQLTSEVVPLLGISLYVLGFAFGPLMWAPVSEMYGRNIPFYVAYTLFTVFHLPCALATNIQTVLVSRFISGFGGSCPLATVGAVLSDIWEAKERGKPMAFFCLMPILGSVLAPVVAGYIAEGLMWSWHFYIMLIFSSSAFLLFIIIVPETYAPVLLKRRAQRLRRETGNDRYKTAQEEKNLTLRKQMKVALTRPFVLLFSEPMLLCLSLYIAFIYGLLYLTFEEFPLVFIYARGWSTGVAGFSFIGLAVGTVIAVFVGNPIQDRLYLRSADPVTKRIPPEARLMSSIVGAVFFAVGLWWFAWTALPPVHWILPNIGTVFFGMGMIILFLGINNYIVDVYLVYAASAIAANSFLRSLAGAVFPLFAIQLFMKLGIPPGTSLLASVATVASPIPFLFYKYGHILRKKSKFAFD